MKNLLDQYKELVALAQEYLLQERQKRKWVESAPESYAFFRTMAEQKVPPKKGVAPPPKKPAPLPIEQPPATTTSKPKKEQRLPKLEPCDPPPSNSLSDMAKIVRECFPHQQICDTPPEPKEAKTPSVLILSTNAQPKANAFLKNLARALRVYGKDAEVMEMHHSYWEKFLKSPELQLVIVEGEHHRKGLPDHLKPVYVLADVSLYLREPRRKALLWKELLSLNTLQ